MLKSEQAGPPFPTEEEGRAEEEIRKVITKRSLAWNSPTSGQRKLILSEKPVKKDGGKRKQVEQHQGDEKEVAGGRKEADLDRPRMRTNVELGVV